MAAVNVFSVTDKVVGVSDQLIPVDAALQNLLIIAHKGQQTVFDLIQAVHHVAAVFALIELNVTPQSQSGYEEIANEIASYDEVASVRLMSGTYDILVEVTGDNIKDVSLFVSQRLATIDAVQSTATHFVLKAYKDNGIIIGGEEKDERSWG